MVLFDSPLHESWTFAIKQRTCYSTFRDLAIWKTSKTAFPTVIKEPLGAKFEFQISKNGCMCLQCTETILNTTCIIHKQAQETPQHPKHSQKHENPLYRKRLVLFSFCGYLLWTPAPLKSWRKCPEIQKTTWSHMIPLCLKTVFQWFRGHADQYWQRNRMFHVASPKKKKSIENLKETDCPRKHANVHVHWVYELVIIKSFWESFRSNWHQQGVQMAIFFHFWGKILVPLHIIYHLQTPPTSNDQQSLSNKKPSSNSDAPRRWLRISLEWSSPTWECMYSTNSWRV